MDDSCWRGWILRWCLFFERNQKQIGKVKQHLAKEPENNAIKIDHVGAKIPVPSKLMLEEIARGIHLAVAGSAAVAMGEGIDSMPSWHDLTDEVKQYWREGARCSYAVIALYGGGKRIDLTDAE